MQRLPLKIYARLIFYNQVKSIITLILIHEEFVIVYLMKIFRHLKQYHATMIPYLLCLRNKKYIRDFFTCLNFETYLRKFNTVYSRMILLIKIYCKRLMQIHKQEEWKKKYIVKKIFWFYPIYILMWLSPRRKPVTKIVLTTQE